MCSAQAELGHLRVLYFLNTAVASADAADECFKTVEHIVLHSVLADVLIILVDVDLSTSSLLDADNLSLYFVNEL